MNRLLCIPILATALAGCSTGGGGLAGDAALDNSLYLEVDLRDGRVVAIPAPDDGSLAGPRWRGTHMLFRRIDSGPVTTGRNGLPTATPDPADALDSRNPVWVAVFELSASQWKAICGDPEADPGELPITGLEPSLVAMQVRALTLSRFRLNLPDEATWMRACTGDGGTIFEWGDSTQAVVSRTYAVHYLPDGTTPTGPRRIGSLQPNRHGLFDMHGNVAETVTLPAGGFALHGGGWDSPVLACRTANRLPIDGDTVHPTIGYRLVLLP